MATNETCEIECFILIDAAGDYAVGKDDESACEAFDEQIGGNGARRMVKVKLVMPLPRPVELAGVVPAECGDGMTLTVS